MQRLDFTLAHTSTSPGPRVPSPCALQANGNYSIFPGEYCRAKVCNSRRGEDTADMRARPYSQTHCRADPN